MASLSKLNKNQKEVIGLLQVGTFLEYFDLMLYVHMAVVLNELFFPPTNPHSAALLAAFAFCSTYVLRPFGALLFGYIGDKIGRKTTVILTTMMMATSCVIMANLPTYAQIGIAATWIVTLCRIMQGLSSMGEIVGSVIYLSETIKPPAQYPAVSFLIVASSLGSTAALGIATLVTQSGLNWRIAFWVGACIAAIGSVARTRLRETPEFLEAKRKRHNRLKAINEENDLGSEGQTPKIKPLTHIAYILVHCGWPMAFYFGYVYFNPLLKEVYGYSSADIIFHNLLLSLVAMASDILLAFLSYHYHPLKILKIKGKLFLFFILSLPFLLTLSNQAWHIFLLQAVLLFISLALIPGDALFIRYFPVLNRFTTLSFVYALTRALMYVITSFCLVFLTESLGYWGTWVITIPVTLGFLWGVNHFIQLIDRSLLKDAEEKAPLTCKAQAT